MLVNASGVPVAAPAGLTFPADGTFSYNTANGSVTFYYRIDTGTWTDGATTADMSADSNIATVTISVPPPPDVTVPVVSITCRPRRRSGRQTAKSCPSRFRARQPMSVAASPAFQRGSHRRIPADRPDPDEVFTFTVTAPVMNTPALKWNASTGAFSLVVQLTASRLGSDTNGRKYDLTGLRHRQGGQHRAADASVSVTAHDKSK